MKYFRKSIPSNRQSSVSLLAVTEEHLSTLLLCRKKIRQSNRRTSVHFVTLSTFYTLYLFDKTRVVETGKRERKDGSRRPEEHRWEVKKAGCPGERAAPARPNGRNDDTKRPGRLSRRGSLRRSFGPFRIVAGVGGWSRKIKSLNDRRLVASLKFACVQPEGSWRKISQAQGAKPDKRFYIPGAGRRKTINNG